MSKKDSGKKKVFKTAGQFQFKDMTLERQLEKARELIQAQNYQEALQILHPLEERLSNRADYNNLMGDAYFRLSDNLSAIFYFEKALPDLKASQANLTRFHLAQSYLFAEYPALAYREIQKVDSLELTRISGNINTGARYREVREMCREAIEAIAGGENKPVEKILEYGPFQDEGRLRLEQGRYEDSVAALRKCIELEPTLVPPRNNLSLVYMLQGNIEQAEKITLEVLEKLEPENYMALCNVARYRHILGKTAESEQTLARIESLKPANSEEILKLAELYAFLEKDKEVYELTRALLVSEFLSSSNREQAYIYAAISAANLGRTDETLQVFEDYGQPSNIMKRTFMAVLNKEQGPREGKRFFYVEPSINMPDVAHEMQTLSRQAIENRNFDTGVLSPLFKKYGKRMLEFVCYGYWIEVDPIKASGLLLEALLSGVEGSREMVERLAFGKVGEDVQRIVAVGTMIQAGTINREDTITMWLGQRKRTGTYQELATLFNRLANNMAGQMEPEYPDEVESLLDYAFERYSQARWDEAIAYYKAALDKHPGIMRAYRGIWAALGNKGDNLGALDYVRRALKIDPEDLYARINEANLLVAVGRSEEAEEAFQNLEPEADAIPGNLMEVYYKARVNLHRKLQRDPEAERLLEEYLEIDPESEWAQEEMKN
jgi:tetratricopeptide (TPR) repeat protein